MRRGSHVARWGRFALLTGVTAVVLVPVAVVVLRAVTDRDQRFSLGAFASQLDLGQTSGRLLNSALVSGATVLVTTLIAAPAGYALSRGRGRATSLFALLVFGLQSLPIVLFLVPLFLISAGLGLVGRLPALAVLYVGLSLAVAVWTISTAVDAVPIAIEEAARLDGCSVFGGFVRVVLPNVRPGLLAAAVATFLFAWNDYWIALVFLSAPDRFTVGLAVATVNGSPAVAVAAMVPPLVVLAVFHRVLRVGGVAGALGGT